MAFLAPIVPFVAGAGGTAAAGATAAAATTATTAAATTAAATTAAATTAAAGAAATSAAATGLTTAQMVALGLQVGGAVIGGYSAYASGQAQGAMADAQSKYNKWQAQDALARGVEEADARRTAVRMLLGTQRAAFGANGVVGNTGSALLTQLDTAYQGELDMMRVRNNAAREAFGYKTESRLSRTRGSMARSAGRYGAMGTILTGGADAYGIWKG